MSDSILVDQLITLVYVSASVELLSEEQVLDILRVSRRNNSGLDITGVLLYESGNFIQVLEGPEEPVRKLAEKIRRDQRHSGYLQLLVKRSNKRHFGQWSMGFKRMAELTGEDRNVFTSYLEDSTEWLQDGVEATPELVKKRVSAAHVLLKSFKQNCNGSTETPVFAAR